MSKKLTYAASFLPVVAAALVILAFLQMDLSPEGMRISDTIAITAALVILVGLTAQAVEFSRKREAIPVERVTQETYALQEQITYAFQRLVRERLRDEARPGVVYVGRALEGKTLSHRFDLVVEQGDKIYLVEIKLRSLVPSDIEGLSRTYTDIAARNRNVEKILLVTTGQVTDQVQRMATNKGMTIVGLGGRGSPNDLNRAVDLLTRVRD